MLRSGSSNSSDLQVQTCHTADSGGFDKGRVPLLVRPMYPCSTSLPPPKPLHKNYLLFMFIQEFPDLQLSAPLTMTYSHTLLSTMWRQHVFIFLYDPCLRVTEHHHVPSLPGEFALTCMKLVNF